MRTFLILALTLTALVAMAAGTEYRQDDVDNSGDNASGDDASGDDASGNDASGDDSTAADSPTGEGENRKFMLIEGVSL
jgi:hypothetical protein